MINYDRLFEEENKDILAQLEANSASILQQLNGETIGNNSLDSIKTTGKNFIEKSQEIAEEMQKNNPLGESSIFYIPVPKLIDHSIKEV